jgi:hypothetical protein
VLASPLVFELDSVRRRFCLFIKSKASKAEADLEDAVRAESVTVAGDGDQLADLWRQRCKLVRGLVASVAQFLSKLQARLQRLHKNWIFGFRYPVYFNDIAFEVVPHENLL